MSISKPYYRNYREIINRPNSGYSSWAYIVDKKYAKNPEHYTRAFLIIQNDLKKLFEYIEPSDENINVYSYRIHELLIRTCIEIEANFKAILKENLYSPKNKKGKIRLENEWNINDFRLINKSHHLNSYSIEIPIWHGNKNIFNPFSSWKNNEKLDWYNAYNLSKHDRQNNFKRANFFNLMNAISGLLVLLSSQFKCESFSPGETSLSIRTASYYSGTFGIGDFFIINFPDDWKEEEKYDFNWSELSKQTDRFQKIDFNNIK